MNEQKTNIQQEKTIDEQKPIIGKILIVDDEQVNAELIRDTLEDVDYEVALALDAISAKMAVKAQTFDLIMMDIWMPGQDGLSLLEEWADAGFKTPVVMMSGHAQPADIVRSIQLGAVDFFVKPLHDILPLIRNILSRRLRQEKTENAGTMDFDLPLKAARSAFERQYFLHHLKRNHYNIAKVSKRAGLERTTLYRKLKDLGIDRK